MSASNEWFEYHLTPRGWFEGSDKLDFSGFTERQAPKDTFLTVCFSENVSFLHSALDLVCKVVWRSQDRSKIAELIKVFGKEPHPNSRAFHGWDEIR